jgi:hypothetical protein
MIDGLIDSIDHSFAPNPMNRQRETFAPVVHDEPSRRRSLAPTHPGRAPGPIS